MATVGDKAVEVDHDAAAAKRDITARDTRDIELVHSGVCRHGKGPVCVLDDACPLAYILFHTYYPHQHSGPTGG